MKKRTLAFILSLVMIISVMVPGTLATDQEQLIADYYGIELCDCGAKTVYDHAPDCALITSYNGLNNTQPSEPTCNCGATGDTHAEDCPLYKAPAEPTCNCGAADDNHAEDCPLYKAPECNCGTETDEHAEDCPLYKEAEEESVFDILMAQPDMDSLYNKLMELTGTNIDDLYALTADELEQLMDRTDEFYNAISEPTDMDAETYDQLMEMWNIFYKCPDCGLEGGEHTEDCPRVQMSVIIDKTGTIGATTITGHTVWKLTGDVTLTGTITIENGARFKIYNEGATSRVIKRADNFSGDMFVVKDGGSFQVNGYAFGNGCGTTGSIYIDGNGKSGYIIKSAGKLAIRDTVLRNNNGSAALYLHGSGRGERYDTAHNMVVTVEITRSSIENCSGGGGIFIAGDTPADYSIDIWHSRIYRCTAIDASAIYFSNGGSAVVTMRNSVVDDCDTTTGSDGQYGGALRTNGNGKYKFTMTDSVLRNCDSWKFGGGIYWNASGPGSKLTVTDCQFLNNTAAEMGGGMFLEGSDMTINASGGSDSNVYLTGMPGDLSGTLIQGNRAPNGGGVCFKCYSNSSEVQVPTTYVKFGANVIFDSNTGKNGPALAYNMHDTHNYPTGATFTFDIDGAQFTNNVGTGAGGAIYVNKCRNDYVCTVNFNSGTIKNNSAKNGGAIAVTTASGVTVGGTFNMAGGTLSENKASDNGGALYLQNGTFNMNGGTVENNEAVNGGSAYITGGTFTMGGGTMNNNTATTNGGAVYVNGGDAVMTDGTISNNTATSGVGGGVNVVGGSFTMSGGNITKNSASGNGGGVSVSGTNTSVTMRNGSISENAAGGNGGGVNISGGSITVEHGTFTNNTAAQNGGAAYVEDGSFTMKSGTMTDNKANGQQSYGGGVYVNGGNIVIGIEDCTDSNNKHTVAGTHHPRVKNNEAVFGGGLATKGGKVDIYCCEILENISANNGTGMNVFGDGGNIHQHGGTIGEETNHGIVVIGGELTVDFEGEPLIIRINYHNNYITSIIWKGNAPEEYYLNLPYCPREWESEQNVKDLTFVGWTVTNEQGEVIDLKHIRDKDGYKALGDPVRIHDVEGKVDADGKKYIDFYAVWAPKTNKITYSYYSYNDAGFKAFEEKVKPDSSYQYQHTASSISIPVPEKAGYTFEGWYLAADTTIISNWKSDATGSGVDADYSNCSFYAVDSSGNDRAGNAWKYEDGNLVINTDRNFGYINMVAKFKENKATISYVAVGPDANATGFGSVDPTSEIVYAVNGNNQGELKATGSTAKDELGYKFVGWYDNEECTGTALSTEKNFVPEKNATSGLFEKATYYAKFDYNLTCMTIKIDDRSVDLYQTVLFKVEGDISGQHYETTVAIHNTGAGGEMTSVSIEGLQVGEEYTVTPIGDWTWRGSITAEGNNTIVLAPNPDPHNHDTINVVKFDIGRSEGKWLSGESYAVNNIGAAKLAPNA